MARAKNSIVRLHEMTPGQSGDFFVLLAEKNRGATRDNKPFFTCRFRDSRKLAVAMIWGDSDWFGVCERDWQVGQFFKIRGTYGEHEVYGPQIALLNIRQVKDEDREQGFDPLDFVERTRFDVEAMYQQLYSLAETHIEDIALRRLVLTILERQGKQLRNVPATTKHFYPFAGGLLEHTLSVTHTSLHLVDKYAGLYGDLHPPLNRDLVMAGAILHDIGRCLEFDDDVANVQRTPSGHLLGHLILGRDLVREVARELGDVDPDLLQLLEHILVTHLTLPEWGSPKLPLIPECLIIHHADDLDAKLEMFARCLMKDKEKGDFTARDPVLGRQLFKGRKT